MGQKDVTVRFCGIAGDGIVTCGNIWSRACAQLGLDVMVNDNFSAEIRGLGKSTTDIRVSPDKVLSMGDGIDVLVALSGTDSIAEIPYIKPGGFVIFDCEPADEAVQAHVLFEHIPDTISTYPVPLTRFSNEAIRATIGRNIVSMGALSYLIGLKAEMFVSLIASKLQKKGEKIVTRNIDAFNIGSNYCREQFGQYTSMAVPPDGKPQNLVTGNDAVAFGADRTWKAPNRNACGCGGCGYRGSEHGVHRKCA